jgi:hypothetical protein
MRRPAAAPHRASAPVKEPQFYSAFVRDSMQIPMRFVQLPRAGQHSAIFVGIGIAQHYLLPPVPGTEQGLILRMLPQTAHHIAGGAQRMNRLEERHRHQSWICIRACQTYSASFHQTDHIQNVVLGLRPANNVVTDRLGGISLLELPDSVEGLD